MEEENHRPPGAPRVLPLPLLAGELNTGRERASEGFGALAREVLAGTRQTRADTRTRLGGRGRSASILRPPARSVGVLRRVPLGGSFHLDARRGEGASLTTCRSLVCNAPKKGGGS